MAQRVTGTLEKAQQINLDSPVYGTFAEIGAGQEVVRWFFRVGAAARTVAKSMSAYAMEFSDAIYGKSGRYVSEERLQHMLDYEYNLLIERLDAKLGADKCFFVYSNTVAARGYKNTNQCHGWMGVKFQVQPKSEPNYITLHVNMLDRETVQQQEALGIIGVNLIHGAFHMHSEPAMLIESLLDALSVERIEVDFIRFSGPLFHAVDNRLMALQLVEQGLSNATILGADGQVYQPSEVLYKKSVLIERGSFRPITWVNLDMMQSAREKFKKTVEDEGQIVEIFEITMNNLLAAGMIDHRDFLARAELAHAVGKNVLISNYAEYYRLASYIWRYTHDKIGLVMGVPNLQEIFNEKYYEKLEGGILESFGRLFKNDLKLYVYPTLDASGAITTVNQLEVEPKLQNLYEHIIENGDAVAIENTNKSYLGIFSRNVLAKIKAHDSTWEEMVPPQVASLIKERGFFGYKPA